MRGKIRNLETLLPITNTAVISDLRLRPRSPAQMALTVLILYSWADLSRYFPRYSSASKNNQSASMKCQ